MSREIKFRFWSGILRTFVVPRDDIFVGALRDPVMHAMQFTGLHDKNGVEIYEGDILREGASLAPVEYIYSEFCAMDVTGNGGCNLIGDSAEVIGNIYENPDLLTKAAG